MHEPTMIPIKRLPGNEDIPLPSKMSKTAAGFDLYAANRSPITLNPGERALIPTGIAMALPENMEAQIRPRSGLALKKGVTCLNAPGTIDADYRGEVGVILINLGEDPFTVSRGDRIAQMVIQWLPVIEWFETDTLPSSDRGSGGFGHTGV